ncbi:tyrosine--tRNA ligase [Candidatus Uhrbacteria bacterium]|nr:tyrosine--tRNA ligase [Candidatus Uhrbacteria bacterium]
MKVSTDSKKIKELLTRGVDTIYPSREALEKALCSGKRMRLYNGIDPTGPELTLGHSVVLRKLEQFRALGHEVILLIGDFTARIGDPTGKTSARKPLTLEEVLANAKRYKEQASPILKFDDTTNPVTVRYNSAWWDSMSVRDFLKLGYLVSVQRLLERDMFEERMKRGEEVSFTELTYPLLQGYDSVAMDVDLEVGGTDQTFNMLMGRRLVDRLKHKAKFVLTTPLLTDASGKKIGKTEGNVIAIDASPDELYGKIMALGDDAIRPVFELCTDVPTDEIREMTRAMKQGTNPRDFKARLAHTLVTLYHSKKAADVVAKNFVTLFRKHEAPEKMPELRVKKTKWNVVDLLVETKLAPSRSEARRLLEQGGIKIDGHTLEGADVEALITKRGHVLQRGKRQFVRIHT